MERLSNARRRALLGHRQRLNSVTRTDDQVAITESLIALHSSDPATVHLSAAARMINPSVVPMATALYEERSLVRHHGMRRTIWVYTPEIARIVLDGTRRAAPGERLVGAELTPREREILRMVAEGRLSPEIARDLELSVKTVEGHRGRIMAKLDSRNVAGLVRHAIRLGLVRAD